jgi:hypothetical protein
MHYLTERCFCRFGILLEKEENGDVFGGGQGEALFEMAAELKNRQRNVSRSMELTNRKRKSNKGN